MHSIGFDGFVLLNYFTTTVSFEALTVSHTRNLFSQIVDFTGNFELFFDLGQEESYGFVFL